jgi:hypothetical protein
MHLLASIDCGYIAVIPGPLGARHAQRNGHFSGRDVREHWDPNDCAQRREMDCSSIVRPHFDCASIAHQFQGATTNGLVPS